MNKPNILLIMCDQLRVDAIAALGNSIVKTPHMDRLVRRGITFSQAYSSCPVCVPARYTVRTGCEPFNTWIYQNGMPQLAEGQPANMEERCGTYLARTLSESGYRTFGIGKFHSFPWNEDLGYDVQLHSEEIWGPEQRAKDAYAGFIMREHPEFSFIEQLHGERTEMYYMPQMSPLPAELTVESWAADRAIEQINKDGSAPYFGFVSFIGPHPPFAPPIPFNRMYDPDRIPNPVRRDKNIDFMDEQIPRMNHLIWAEDINDSHARVLKAKYYGEITYIDQCLGKILDAVEARDDADNTLICFFSDHGDHMGDHHAWQKGSFFEASCHVPFLVSWPARLSQNSKNAELVCLTDLFAIATHAAGITEIRDGIDVLGVVDGLAEPRKYLFGYYGEPGTPLFKIMVRYKDWKYIYMANGRREQLFNLSEDLNELTLRNSDDPEITASLRQASIDKMRKHPGLQPALCGDKLRGFEFRERPLFRIHQFDISNGIDDFTMNNKIK